MYNRFTQLTSLVLIIIGLSACGGENSSADPTSSEQVCPTTGDNFIRDTGFATLFEGMQRRQWQISQHSSRKSFEYTVKEGVLEITQTASEPWSIVAQSQDVSALAGKTVVLSAEIKLDLKTPENPHGFKLGGGLSLVAKRNNKIAVRSIFNHEPHMGVSDWTPVRVIVHIPPKVDFIRVAILHQADGTIRARNPSLKLADSSSAYCVPTAAHDNAGK